MNFAAKTEKQLSEEGLMPEGIYPFDVMSAEAKKSKKGNDMIEMELRVYADDGREHKLLDWLMPVMGFKLFHFCAYTGLSRQYENGTLNAEDCIGKSGYVKIVIQPDKEKKFPDRNSVKDYVRPEPKLGSVKVGLSEAQQNNVTEKAGEPDDVPF